MSPMQIPPWLAEAELDSSTVAPSQRAQVRLPWTPSNLSRLAPLRISTRSTDSFAQADTPATLQGDNQQLPPPPPPPPPSHRDDSLMQQHPILPPTPLNLLPKTQNLTSDFAPSTLKILTRECFLFHCLISLLSLQTKHSQSHNLCALQLLVSLTSPFTEQREAARKATDPVRTVAVVHQLNIFSTGSSLTRCLSVPVEYLIPECDEETF